MAITGRAHGPGVTSNRLENGRLSTSPVAIRRETSLHVGIMATPQAFGLEPPGFLALTYGYQTPASVLLAHLIYGAILGTFYAMPPS